MDYISNYTPLGDYELSMPPLQLFYPEMNGIKGYEQGSATENRVRCIPNNYYDGGDYKHGQKNESMNEYRFYNGEDFKQQENMGNTHNAKSGPQRYMMNSATGYRSFARQNRRAKEMQARNGLYEPREDVCHKINNYPSYSDEIGQRSNRSFNWQ